MFRLNSNLLKIMLVLAFNDVLFPFVILCSTVNCIVRCCSWMCRILNINVHVYAVVNGKIGIISLNRTNVA